MVNIDLDFYLTPYIKTQKESLVIREMQIKTTVRYLFTASRIGVIKKADNKC